MLSPSLFSKFSSFTLSILHKVGMVIMYGFNLHHSIDIHSSELRLGLTIPPLQLMLLVKLPYMLFVSGYRWYSELWSRRDETLLIQTRRNALVAGLDYDIIWIHQYGNGFTLQGNLICIIVSNIVCILLLSFNVSSNNFGRLINKLKDRIDRLTPSAMKSWDQA